jgi:hypothetical protein
LIISEGTEKREWKKKKKSDYFHKKNSADKDDDDDDDNDDDGGDDDNEEDDSGGGGGGGGGTKSEETRRYFIKITKSSSTAIGPMNKNSTSNSSFSNSDFSESDLWILSQSGSFTSSHSSSTNNNNSSAAAAAAARIGGKYSNDYVVFRSLWHSPTSDGLLQVFYASISGIVYFRTLYIKCLNSAFVCCCRIPCLLPKLTIVRAIIRCSEINCSL